MSTQKRWAPQPTFSDLIPRPETHSRKCSRTCRAPFFLRVGCEDPFQRFWRGSLAENCSSTVSVLVQYCSSTAPVLLFQYCFNIVPVLLQYCFSAVPMLFLYSTSTAPVLFQCCPNTHPSIEYEGAAERSVQGPFPWIGG